MKDAEITNHNGNMHKILAMLRIPKSKYLYKDWDLLKGEPPSAAKKEHYLYLFYEQ